MIREGVNHSISLEIFDTKLLGIYQKEYHASNDVCADNERNGTKFIINTEFFR